MVDESGIPTFGWRCHFLIYVQAEKAFTRQYYNQVSDNFNKVNIDNNQSKNSQYEF